MTSTGADHMLTGWLFSWALTLMSPLLRASPGNSWRRKSAPLGGSKSTLKATGWQKTAKILHTPQALSHKSKTTATTQNQYPLWCALAAEKGMAIEERKLWCTEETSSWTTESEETPHPCTNCPTGSNDLLIGERSLLRVLQDAKCSVLTAERTKV